MIFMHDSSMAPSPKHMFCSCLSGRVGYTAYLIKLNTSFKKIKILSSIKDHRKKIGKQGKSPTPAAILVNI